MTVFVTSPIKLPVQTKTGVVRLSPVGLTVGTPIMTSMGERAVEDLKTGDRVLTKDLGMQSVKCVAFRDVNIAAAPSRAPVRIPSGTFGDERPGSDIYLAPTQRIALRHRMFDVLFASREVLVSARDLVGFGGIRQVEGLRAVTYVSLGFLQHHLLYCGNLAVDLGPTSQSTSRPALSAEEARLACSLLRPNVLQHSKAVGFPLH